MTEHHIIGIENLYGENTICKIMSMFSCIMVDQLGQYVLILIIELVVNKLMLLLPLRSVPGLPPAPKATPQPPAVSARETELQVLFLTAVCFI